MWNFRLFLGHCINMQSPKYLNIKIITTNKSNILFINLISNFMQKQIKKLMLAVMAIIVGVFAQAETLTPRPGVVRVKLQQEVATQVGNKEVKAKAGKLTTGVRALDAVATKAKVKSMRRVFPYSPKFEARMKAYGLDRWYEVSFDESMSPAEVKAMYEATAGVQVATMKVPMKFTDGNGTPRPVTSIQATRPTENPFNDPRLSSQWHYNNTGSLAGSRAGADINLFEAWKTTTGRKNVIVAIIDGGIDYNHEDLAANICINKDELNGTPGVDDDGNGYVDDVYGWNFCTNTKDVYPHTHGTHVAGTVAAVNNNGIGVCGVAGGDGTAGTGVQLLSVQVFDSRTGSGDADFAAGIVYAANRGASIANCSWGWATEGYVEQDVLDAIDYFIGTKGNVDGDDVMRAQRNLSGGIMFFSTGNDGATGQFYPGCYPPVVAVGSMTNDFTIAPYSNYGEWVDIVAPGGLLTYGNAGGVLSTLPDNSYGFYEGTSMATPHVTGVAALVVSEHGNSDMPAETIKQQILTSVNDIYEYNPSVQGLHGAGYIDAVKALQMSPDGEAPEAVTSFSAYPAQDNITVEWVIPNSSTGVVNQHILYYSTSAFTAESDLSKLSSVAIDTKFYASGDVFTYELSGLKSLTTYYLALKAVDRWGNASALSPVVEATTNEGPKMTIDASSLAFTIDAASSLVGSGSFGIGNDASGLLKWTGKIADKSYAPATQSLSNILAPGRVGKLKGRIGAETHASTTESFSTADYQAGEYPKRLQWYSEYWASIGEEDKSVPNSLAQYFYVDPDKYADGFNLTHVEVTSIYGKDPTLQIYRAGGALTPANMLQEIVPSWFYSGQQIQLTEQIHFAPGEAFWVVVHFPAESNDYYPLGLGKAEGAYIGYSYMSNDLGATWVPLKDALKGSYYESLGDELSWTVAALSKNPAWSKVFRLDPAEGNVKQGELQTVNLINDGQPIVNGTYKFNVSFSTNESTKNSIVLPVTVTVKGNKPVMSTPKIVNFGSLLVGESKTIEVEVMNEGYGVYTGNYGYLQQSNWSINSEHYSLKDVPTGGFPARSTSTFKAIYTPLSAGTHSACITFTSKDGIEFKVYVHGVAIEPAKIVVEPSTIELGNIDVAAEPSTTTFKIKNEGKYPLEYVFPKFSDRQLEVSLGKPSHKFGYSRLTNLDGATDFAYDGNPALLGATEITSTFTDNVRNSRAIALGFDFPFYGKTYSEVYINSLGGLAFELGEYSYFPPLTPTSSSLEGVPYISAYGHQLQFGPNSHVTYAKQDGKFVVNFSNVLAVKYDVETTPISFHIALSANGDIEIFYDDYVRTEIGYDDWGMETEIDRLFQGGSTLFCGIKDANNKDALVVTSADIADYWGSGDDPEGQVYKLFTTGSAVKFEAPAPYFITDVTPAYGLVSPGEEAELTATINPGDDINAGDTFNRLTIETNDPTAAAAYVTFNATFSGDNLTPQPTVESNLVDFGKVFRTSVAKMPVTVKNAGRDAFTINSVSFASSKFSTETELPATVKPGMSKDIIVIMPTETEGALLDALTITTSAGNIFVSLTGEVIGCPEITLSIDAIEETVESGTPLTKELTVTNSGNETLEFSITPGSFTSVNDPEVANAKVSYVYSSSSDNDNVKFEWIDIEHGIGDRNGFSYYNVNDYLEVTLPFAFPFYGQEYTKMYIYNTGFVSFTKRNDDKIWPEPPADFPKGSVYTNILAPYWGLHTMDVNETAGTYHYMTDDEVVVSWMEYGNTMNAGVCFQLIMHKDGSFKFQYKGYDENSIIFNTFGLAGACNEGGSEYFVIPDRFIKFGNAVQFSPVTLTSVEAGASKTVTLEVATGKMAGFYTDALSIASNVPGSESLEIPIALTVTGEACPVFPEPIVAENVAFYQETPSATSGPGVMYMGAPWEAQFKIENTGTAAMTIVDIAYESPLDDWDYPLYQLMAQMMVPDWLTGETTLQWQVYENYRGMPIEVTPSQPLLLSMPMSWDTFGVVGETSLPITVTYTLDGENYLEKVIDLKFVVTDIPEIALDRAEIFVEGVAPDYKGTETLNIANYGNYKLTYSLNLDMSGEGEQIGGDDDGGGVMPMNVGGKLSDAQLAELSCNINTEVKPFAATPGSVLDAPTDFSYNNVLFYPAAAGSSTPAYGTGNKYGLYTAATHFTAPEEGFNISHIYIASTLVNSDGSYLSSGDITVDIVAGSDYENGNIVGTGSFHLARHDGAHFLIVPLDRAVFLNPGQEFYVRVHYPEGVEYPAYLCSKADPVVDNRYMGHVEGYGWFDLAAMFKNQYGSLGYIMSCLETVPGSPWVKMLNAETEGEIQPGESLDVNFELNALTAPLETGNKAMLVIKSNDPAMPVVNFPIQLDRNRKPVITAPEEAIVVSEGTAPSVFVTVTEPEADDFSIFFTDNAGIAAVKAVTVDAGTVEVTEEGYSVKGANVANLEVVISPDYKTAGEYSFSVFATDAYNQEASSIINYTVEHANRAPEALPIADVTLAVGASSDVINFADYFADPDGDDVTYAIKLSAENIVKSFVAEGSVIFYGNAEGAVTVTVTATDALGAATSTSFTITVSEGSGVAAITADAAVKAYPNPVVATLYVASGFTGKVKYEIFSENGSKVYIAEKETATGVAQTIDVSSLARGIYILKVSQGDKAATYPVIRK